MARCISHSCAYCLVVLLSTVQAVAVDLCVSQDGPRTELSLCGGEAFHTTEAQVTDARLIAVPDSTVALILWNERAAGGEFFPYYAISFDGQEVQRVRKTSYDLKLKYARFNPLEETPPVDPALAADASSHLYIVQFVTQSLEALRSGVGALGATLRGFVPNHAYVVEMSEAVKTQVEALPYVRWVGPHHPAYRLEGYLWQNLDRANELAAACSGAGAR